MSADATTVPPPPRWTPREAELLTVTLDLLRRHGYDRLSVEAVATQAKASKSTVYRRWPSKADLVLAAFIEGTRCSSVPPRTGTLRGDLLIIGGAVCRQIAEHASTMGAVINEMSHNPGLRAAMQDEFVDQRKTVIRDVLAEAAKRGEIDPAAPVDEIYDLLPGYLVFRGLISGRPPDEDTVEALVDHVLLPYLTRSVP